MTRNVQRDPCWNESQVELDGHVLNLAAAAVQCALRSVGFTTAVSSTPYAEIHQTLKTIACD